jgi:hypothetical protein
MSKFLCFGLLFLLTACGSLATVQPAAIDLTEPRPLEFTQWDVPHTNLTMVLPNGWVSEYQQGTIRIVSDARYLLHSLPEEFEGVLINMFVSDAPQVAGPAFNVMKLAEDAIANLANILQTPKSVEENGRQIVTTLHINRNTKGKRIIYLSAYILEDQQLTVFLAATPTDTEFIFLPILTKMLHSIEIRSFH